MHHRWRGVEDFTQAMTAEICDNTKALAFRIGLDSVTDIAQCCAGLYFIDAFHQAIIRDIDKTPRFYWYFIADQKHT